MKPEHQDDDAEEAEALFTESDPVEDIVRLTYFHHKSPIRDAVAEGHNDGEDAALAAALGVAREAVAIALGMVRSATGIIGMQATTSVLGDLVAQAKEEASGGADNGKSSSGTASKDTSTVVPVLVKSPMPEPEHVFV